MSFSIIRQFTLGNIVLILAVIGALTLFVVGLSFLFYISDMSNTKSKYSNVSLWSAIVKNPSLKVSNGKIYVDRKIYSKSGAIKNVMEKVQKSNSYKETSD